MVNEAVNCQAFLFIVFYYEEFLYKSSAFEVKMYGHINKKILKQGFESCV